MTLSYRYQALNETSAAQRSHFQGLGASPTDRVTAPRYSTNGTSHQLRCLYSAQPA